MVEFPEHVKWFDQAHQEIEKHVEDIVSRDHEEESEENKDEENAPTDMSYLKGKKGVSDFWVKAMKACGPLWTHVKEKDKPILKHLQHIETLTSETEITKNQIYTLKMHFAKDNGFFTPEVLELNLEYETEDRVKTIKATKIDWLEGKDPTKKKMKKKLNTNFSEQ